MGRPQTPSELTSREISRKEEQPQTMSPLPASMPSHVSSLLHSKWRLWGRSDTIRHSGVKTPSAPKLQASRQSPQAGRASADCQHFTHGALRTEGQGTSTTLLRAASGRMEVSQQRPAQRPRDLTQGPARLSQPAVPW